MNGWFFGWFLWLFGWLLNELRHDVSFFLIFANGGHVVSPEMVGHGYGSKRGQHLKNLDGNFLLSTILNHH